jgi:1-acyl-sn-glycerol-3-phosphate acyltransferase
MVAVQRMQTAPQGAAEQLEGERPVEVGRVDDRDLQRVLPQVGRLVVQENCVPAAEPLHHRQLTPGGQDAFGFGQCWVRSQWCVLSTAPNAGGPVSSTDIDPTEPVPSEITKWDPHLTERVMGWIRPLIKGYHRAEVRGLDSFPPGGALVVSNHSGGLIALDIPVFATGFYEKFGYDRPVYTLSHDIIFTGPTGRFFKKTGFIRANHENAAEALRSGGVVVVFPGGDYDVYRPTRTANVIDFGGRTGYLRAALQAGVPIVPAVSIGGQENQIYLSRGEGLAHLLRLDTLMRVKILPISLGFPFGLSAVLPVNVPLPTKIVTQVLEPVDIVALFGEDPDIDEVDDHVRHLMQRALDKLAKERRFPVIG